MTLPREIRAEINRIRDSFPFSKFHIHVWLVTMPGGRVRFAGWSAEIGHEHHREAVIHQRELRRYRAETAQRRDLADKLDAALVHQRQINKRINRKQVRTTNRRRT